MLQFSDVTKSHGGRVLFKNAGFQANVGDRIGLVGPNGAGKTTVFRLLTGKETVDSGAVSFPQKLVIGYFSQNVGEMSGRSVLHETLAGAGDLSKMAKRIAEIESLLGEPMDDDAMAKLLEEYGELQSSFETRGGYDLDVRARTILSGLGFSEIDFERQVEHFSGGWKMRIALARILLMNPDALLMDEPTNHLDLESIVWLEEWLQNYPGILIMTSHDRTFMNRVVNRIIEISSGTFTLYSGNYDFYERERVVRREQLLASYKRQQDMLAKEEEFIAKFAARASHAAQVQSRVKKLEKIERVEIPPEEKSVKFLFNKPPRSGDDVVRMKGMGKTWHSTDGHSKKVFSGVSATVRRLDKIALVGVNGAGKSTLMKIIAGQTDVTEGQWELGASLEVGYFSQHALEVLDPSKSIFEMVQTAIPRASVGTVKTLLGSFLFSDDEVNKKIAVLSGGEKSRVALACILARPVNFILLDEPTNHLDIKSREILMDALKDFEGTLVVVSHDRHFLKQITNRVFKIDHGEMHVYEGGFAEYLESAQHDARAH
jgi:ATP-binding cassette subfamily F protein 3